MRSARRVNVLQGINAESGFALHGSDRFHSGAGASEGRHGGYGVIKGCTTQVFVVVSCLATDWGVDDELYLLCLLYTSPSPRDATLSRMPSSA